jgi:WD40 repeat protein
MGNPSDCVFSPDETLLTLCSAEGIEIVEIASGKIVAKLKTAQPNYCAFAPDGKRLAFGNRTEKSVCIWDITEPGTTENITLPAEPSIFAWSHNEQLLAVGCADNSIQLFHTRNWQKSGSLQGHRQIVLTMAFNHRDDMLVSNASDRTLRIWDLRTMTQLVEQTGYMSDSSICFSPDDSMVGTTDNMNSVAIVMLVGLQRVCTAFCPPSLKEQLVPGSTLDYSPDSKLLALSSATSVRIFDAKRTQLLLTIPIPVPTQTTLRFLADGETLAVLSRRTGLTLHHFSYKDGTFKILSSRNQEQFLSYAFGSAPSDSSSLLCLTSEKETKGIVWDSSTEQILCTISASPTIENMAISPDRKHIVTAYKDRVAQVSTFPSGNKTADLAGGMNGDITFSPNGRWLGAGGTPADHLLWNTGDWTRGPVLPPEVEEKTSRFSFSYDEKYLAATIRDRTALVFLPAGDLIATLEQRIQPNLYSHLRFSPDGAQLASQGVDNSLILWDLAELQSELLKLNLNW